MPSQSPLRAKPLRVPGHSLDREIDRWVTETASGYYIAAAFPCMLAAIEWMGYLTHSPRHPIIFSVLAAIARPLRFGSFGGYGVESVSYGWAEMASEL
jgi:hypothetical protein